MGSFVLTAQKATKESPIGGKARALLSLCRAGFPVPEWAIIIPEAWSAGNDPANRATLEREILDDLLKYLPDIDLFAVRSSASDEDGAEHSFAGQLESYLFVPREKLLEKGREVWASGFSERIAAYRKERCLLLPRSRLQSWCSA